MSKRDDGGRAFPGTRIERIDGAYRDVTYPGLSIRDWFAGQSIAGENPGRLIDDVHVKERAAAAYRIADAMIAERKKPESSS